MNTIEALQKLYVAMGGQAADVENLSITPDMINAIAEVYQGGGGGAALPEVTAADNNKLLTVVNGAWDKANAPKELPSVTAADNGKVLIANNGIWNKSQDNIVRYVPYTGTTDPDTGTVSYTCELTAGQIATKLAQGSFIVAKIQIDGGITYYLPLVGVGSIGGANSLCFGGIASTDGITLTQGTIIHVGGASGNQNINFYSFTGGLTE